MWGRCDYEESTFIVPYAECDGGSTHLFDDLESVKHIYNCINVIYLYMSYIFCHSCSVLFSS